MSRVYNFGAGPAAIPTDILLQAKEELLDWDDLGMSVMEVSHRSPHYMKMMQQAEQDLRELMSIPDDYSVLFLAGPARAQFSAIPLNLLGDKTTADYIDTGIWSRMAIEEAQRYCKVNVAADAQEFNYFDIPERSTWQLNPDAAYVYYTDNETISGVEFPEAPVVGDVPLVADMTSSILSRPMDVTKFGLIFAGSQKNMGCAGLTVIIVRNDLLGKAMPTTPTVFDYKFQAEKQSLFYTPTTIACYMAGLMFQWLKQQGGLKAMEEINAIKAKKLYDFIDASSFYSNPVNPTVRSRMNIPFILADSEQDKAFLDGAHKAGMSALKGHRLVGGMRASIYNAMPMSGVDRLVEYMAEFERGV